MRCETVRKHLDAYIDTELEASATVAFERHLEGCSDCRDELALTRVLKQSVKREFQAPGAPDWLRARICQELDGVSLKERQDDTRRSPSMQLSLWAVAAGVLLAFGSSLFSHDINGMSDPSLMPAAVSGLQLPVFSEIVNRHTDALPAEAGTEAPEKAASWFRDKVGFRVQSVQFDEPKVRFAGARVSHVGSGPAAKFYYDVGDSRLTLVVFKAPAPLREVLQRDGSSARSGLQRARVGGRVLNYTIEHGYTVPLIQRDGIVYAFTGDMDHQALMRLVATAKLP